MLRLQLATKSPKGTWLPTHKMWVDLENSTAVKVVEREEPIIRVGSGDLDPRYQTKNVEISWADLDPSLIQMAQEIQARRESRKAIGKELMGVYRRHHLALRALVCLEEGRPMPTGDSHDSVVYDAIAQQDWVKVRGFIRPTNEDGELVEMLEFNKR